MKSICCSLLFLLLTNANSAQISKPQRDIAQQYFAKNSNITSLSLTYQCKGLNHFNPQHILLNKNNNNEIFQAGSITKSFISVILLQLETESAGQFSIEDDLGKWFPEYPNWAGITIKQLMNMTSGIPDYTKNPKFINRFYQNINHYWTAKEILMYEKSQRLSFKPGSKWDYSNTNYILLGLLIEKLTKDNLSNVINKRIIQKINLTNTNYVQHFPNKNLVKSQFEHNNYSYAMGEASLSWIGAAGAIVSTTDDINLYIRKLFSTDELLTAEEKHKLLSFISTSSAKNVQKPSRLNSRTYGLGIVAEYDNKQDIRYVYEGITLGYKFLYVFYPKSQISIVTALNSLEVEDEWSLVQNILTTMEPKCAS